MVWPESRGAEGGVAPTTLWTERWKRDPLMGNWGWGMSGVSCYQKEDCALERQMTVPQGIRGLVLELRDHSSTQAFNTLAE